MPFILSRTKHQFGRDRVFYYVSEQKWTQNYEDRTRFDDENAANTAKENESLSGMAVSWED